MLRIATWNVNSLRARLAHLRLFTENHQPDIVCLQETRVQDHQFPHEQCASLGYPHRITVGIPGYNGVAILARTPIIARNTPLFGRQDARHLSIDVPEHRLRIENLYVPAGGDVPDSEQNEKFAYKLDFMTKLTARMTQEQPRRTILLGDINIAPGQYDVWSHQAMSRVVSHTPVECLAFADLLASNQWCNALREKIPEPTRLSSWWSYRVRDWTPLSRGLLLDHILLSPDLADGLHEAAVVENVRGWPPKPSDHAPLVVDLDC